MNEASTYLIPDEGRVSLTSYLELQLEKERRGDEMDVVQSPEDLRYHDAIRRVYSARPICRDGSITLLPLTSDRRLRWRATQRWRKPDQTALPCMSELRI